MIEIPKFNSAQELYKYTQDNVRGMSQTARDMEILWEATKDAKVYVEIGTMYGISAFAVWVGNPECMVTTFDINDCDERKRLHEGTAINFYQQKSPECARGWIHPIDVLLIDGCHDYQDVLEDFAGWSPYVKEGGSVLFHDYSHSSPGVREFCEKFIIGHSAWKVKHIPEDIVSCATSYLWAVKKIGIPNEQE